MCPIGLVLNETQSEEHDTMDTDAETIKNDLFRQANEDGNPLARAVYNHKFLHEKEQDQVDKGLVKRRCEIPK